MDPQMRTDKQIDKNARQSSFRFKEYPSIDSSMKGKLIKAIKDHEFDKNNVVWVASEKIHGSNFSVHCTGQKIRYGRRNDFITEEIDMQCDDVSPYFIENFYDARNLVNTFHNKIVNIHKSLKVIYPELIKFTIFGQYFGGFYPGIQQNFKRVQRGVYYIPHHQFMAFDINVQTSKKNEWVDVTDIPKILGQNIKSVPIYAKGTFEEIFSVNSKIDSTIPELCGFPRIEKNIIEGFVIRPNSSLSFRNKNRVILKKKNEEFLQAFKAPNKQKKQKGQKGQEVQASMLQMFLNTNRIESVVSKFPDLKDLRKLTAYVIEDIMLDFIKYEDIDEEKKVNKKVGEDFEKKVMKALNEYFSSEKNI